MELWGYVLLGMVVQRKDVTMSKKKVVYMYKNMVGLLAEAMNHPNPDWVPTVYASPPGRKYIAIPLEDPEDEGKVCHCGQECNDHTEASGHTTVPMDEPLLCDSCCYPAEHYYCEPCYQSAGVRISFAENQAECAARQADTFHKEADKWEDRALAAEAKLKALYTAHDSPKGKRATPKMPTGWGRLQKAAKEIKSVRDGQTRIVLTHLLNALRLVTSCEDGMEAKDKHILIRDKLVPTDAYVQVCAEALHDVWCNEKDNCLWDDTGWKEEGTEKWAYHLFASHILREGIDIDDTRKVLQILCEIRAQGIG